MTTDDGDDDAQDSSSSDSFNEELNTEALTHDVDFSNFNPDEQGES